VNTTSTPMTTLAGGSLFSGVAGLDLAVTEVFGTKPEWFCDNDPAASCVLAHRYPDVPNLRDITTVDWAGVLPVWLLTGGFPCQDISAAGQRAGLVPGTRSGLWSHMATAIRILRPAVVVIENVRNLLNAQAHHPAHRDLEPCPWCLGDRTDRPVLRALGAVLGDLADLGYDAVWHGLRVADVGGCHARFRVFILAHRRAVDPRELVELAADAARQRRGEGRPEPAGLLGGPDAALGGGEAAADPDHVGPQRERRARERGTGSADRGDLVADADGARWRGAGDALAGVRTAAFAGAAGGVGRGDRVVADADGQRQRPDQPDLPGRTADPVGRGDNANGGSGVDWGHYGAAVRRWERLHGHPAPVPHVTGARGGLKLNPALCEWMQGFPPGWFTDVPGVGVNDALRLAGNSVNPYQAIASLQRCLAVLSEHPRTTDHLFEEAA
jgi:DNA (cytosine-5)-methyltransferase 1